MSVEKYIEIVRYENQEVVETKGPYPDWKANRIDDGLNINLNHELFYTRIRTAAEILKRLKILKKKGVIQ